MEIKPEPLVFEKSVAGRGSWSVPAADVPEVDLADLIPPRYLRDNLSLPELTEGALMRHYLRLSRKNYCVDTGFYPLGSCTMKYNPRLGEDISRLPGFTGLHPLLPDRMVQGMLQVLGEMQDILCQVTGMDGVSFQPVAGAQGEFAGLLIMRSWHKSRGENRTRLVVPDSSHGTNPASSAMAGFEMVKIPSDSRGLVDLEALKGVADENLAGLMLTNPNTLGLFEEEILEIARIVHDCGGLLYYDGANLNAIMGMARPADMGFDVVHLNLHKTFATPHGGGGPGSGPICVTEPLVQFLPVPVVEKAKDGTWRVDWDRSQSIGKISAFHGNIGVVLKAYSYVLSLGGEGLKEVSTDAVLNARYLASLLAGSEYEFPYDSPCMHEFVMSAAALKKYGIKALDVAKSLLDKGFHAPTVYFPLIVEEAMLVEPTETEALETLEAFAEALLQIAREAAENPEALQGAPRTTPVTRLDEAGASRKPDICWNCSFGQVG